MNNSAWLSLAPGGTANAQFVVATVNTAGLVDGVYIDTIAVSGGGADNTALCVVTLSVGDALAPPSGLSAVSSSVGGPIELAWTDNTANDNYDSGGSGSDSMGY